MNADDFQKGLAGVTSVELYGPEDGGWYTTRVHDWIALCPFLRDPDVRAYLVLRALVLEKYKNPVRKLTLAVLCELIPGPNGKPSSLTRVRSMLAGLSSVGLICTPEGGPVKTSSRAGAAQRTIRIRINDMPSEGYQGWRNAEVKLSRINEAAAEREAGRNSDPGGGEGDQEEGAGRNSDPAGCNSDPGGSNSDPDPAPEQPERDAPLVPSFGTTNIGDALAGRSPGDARRASSGSSACEGEGGSAASGKTSPSPTPNDDTRGPARDLKGSSKKAKHTPEQLAVVRQVRSLFPPEFLKTLSDVPSLTDAILAGMAEGRTVEQMGARIMYRWVNHGWAEKFGAKELDPKRLVGPAVDMVRPLRKGDRFACPDLRCEAGIIQGTEEACKLCPERIEDWKAERSRERAQGLPVGAKSTSVPAGSPDGALPPQRGVVQAAPERVGCPGRAGTCGAGLGFGQTLCWTCSEAAAEQNGLENAGAPAPF